MEELITGDCEICGYITELEETRVPQGEKLMLCKICARVESCYTETSGFRFLLNCLVDTLGARDNFEHFVDSILKD